MTDLIIGCGSNYTWDQLKYWVNSIRKTNFDGDVVIVGNNIDINTIKELEKNNVIVAPTLCNARNDAPHVGRFLMIWEYLHSCEKTYRYVITTDTKDVIFQANPSIDVKHFYDRSFIFSSEGMKYKHEPWGHNNISQAFGNPVYSVLYDKTIYNVGVIAGLHKSVQDLCLMIYELSQRRPISIVDQAVFNFIIQQEPYRRSSWYSTNDDSWSVQLGTTVDAVKAGAGDLGAWVSKSPSLLINYQLTYDDAQPIIDNDVVRNKEGQIITIVHQYDRIPALKEKIYKKYGD